MLRLMIKIFNSLLIIFLTILTVSCGVEYNSETVTVTDDWEIDRHTKITYSKHAICRMDCRFIDEEEIREVLMQKNIDYDRTRVSHQGESRAYEGMTRDGQEVRIVISEKSSGHVHVVTVIDLKNDWSCAC